MGSYQNRLFIFEWSSLWMSFSDEEILKIHYMQEYRDHGLPARVAMINFFLDNTSDEAKKIDLSKDEEEKKLDLTNRQKLSLLQVGTTAHIMMLIEDMATIFTSFKNEDGNYYKYLDSKEEDLGEIIGKFYNGIEDLSGEELRKILGYVDPKKLMEYTESDKDFLLSIIQKNEFTFRYFLKKVQRFWSGHIGIFRRYKHAGLPIFLGQKIPKGDSLFGNKFDFVSLATTSKENISEEITLIPFSLEALNSYHTLVGEIAGVFFYILERNLIKMERKLHGIVPTPKDGFDKRLTKKEIKRLEKLYRRFLDEHPVEQENFHATTMPKGMYPVWYTHLDYLSKSYIDLANEKINM